jgi:PGF-pre-PGF domain-containing protein
MKFVGSSTRNVIYNNFFNSTLNYNETDSTGNFFNVTKTAGTNIVGGDYIGGNYWGFLNGTGFSETCTDADGDDICDSVYDLSDGSYDYLPLKLISFALPELPGDTISPSGGSLPTITETQSVKITAGSSTSFEIKNKDIDIRNITIFAKENISGNLVVSKNDTGNMKIAFPAGNLYQAFTITANAISNEDLNNVTIDFRVNKTWLVEQNGTYDNVVLYRMPTNDSLWESLTTTSIREDSVYYYFSAVSPGFSMFIILIHDKALDCTPSQTRCFNDELQSCSENKTWTSVKTCEYGCENGKCTTAFQSNLLYLLIVVGVTIAIILVFYFFKKKKGKKKRR